MSENLTERKIGHVRKPHPMKMGLSILELSRNSKDRRQYGLSKKPITASNGLDRFTVLRWNREEDTLQMSLVDKRAIKAGIIVTRLARLPQTESARVTVFSVNEGYPNSGLRRIANSVHPLDVAPYVVIAYEKSVIPTELSGRPDFMHMRDYETVIDSIKV